MLNEFLSILSQKKKKNAAELGEVQRVLGRMVRNREKLPHQVSWMEQDTQPLKGMNAEGA